MRSGRSRPSLGERAADSGIAAARDAAEPVGLPDDRPARRGADSGRHCWVTDPPGWPGTWPGLLVEWRQQAGSWHGRVAFSVPGPHGPVLVETWLPADRLRQR
jgi:hypothetical protein